MIPKRTLEALERWRDDAAPPGDFLRAVLENNLMMAFHRADEENTAALRDIVAWCYNHLPLASWGNKYNIDNWERICHDTKDNSRICSGQQEGQTSVETGVEEGGGQTSATD